MNPKKSTTTQLLLLRQIRKPMPRPVGVVMDKKRKLSHVRSGKTRRKFSTEE